MPTLLPSVNNNLLLTGQMNRNQIQRDCYDSRIDTCKDLSFSQSLVVWASAGEEKEHCHNSHKDKCIHSID